MSSTQTTGTTTWQIDPAHSHIEFQVRHLMITNVKGRFGAVEGTIVLDEADPTRSKVQADIDVASIDTREEKRDAHLRSADFFDVENHPTMTFRSKRIERSGDDYTLVGDLTIRGTTREVQLDVEEEGRAGDPWGGERISFTAKGKIDRTAYGLTWNQALETGGVMVGNDVKISLEVQAVKQA